MNNNYFSLLSDYSLLLFIPDLFIVCLLLSVFLFFFLEIIFYEEGHLHIDTIKAYDVVFLLSCFLIGYITGRVNYVTF